MAWDILNSLCRLLIMAILIWKLLRFPDLFNCFERAGMGIAAGSALMTIDVIWTGQRSPFDGWAATLFSFGVLLYFVGRSSRHWRHERAHIAQVGIARRHFSSRG